MDHQVQVLVLVFGLEGEFLAVGDAIGHLEQLLGDLSDCECLALLDLSA